MYSLTVVALLLASAAQIKAAAPGSTVDVPDCSKSGIVRSLDKLENELALKTLFGQTHDAQITALKAPGVQAVCEDFSSVASKINVVNDKDAGGVAQGVACKVFVLCPGTSFIGDSTVAGGPPTTTWGFPKQTPSKYTATANIAPINGSTIQGTLTLSQEAESPNVFISVSLKGIPANTVHGFHIHAFGDASTPLTGLNMGGHFNPSNVSHGCANTRDSSGVVTLPATIHFGDLGSVTADKDGNAAHSWVSAQLSLFDPTKPGFVLGRGVIVHSLADDCVTQPTGNSSTRLAQGVITTTTDFSVSAFPKASSLNAIAVFQGDSSSVKGLVSLDREKSALLFNLTGLAPSKKYVLESYYTGDTTKIKTVAVKETKCDAFDGGDILGDTIAANDKGELVTTSKIALDGWSTQKLFGRGFVLVGVDGNCPVAAAAVGVQFVAPPVTITTTTTGTATDISAKRTADVYTSTTKPNLVVSSAQQTTTTSAIAFFFLSLIV